MQHLEESAKDLRLRSEVRGQNAEVKITPNVSESISHTNRC